MMNKLLYILIILLTLSSCKRGCEIEYLEEPVVKIQFLKKDSCLNIFDEPAQCYNPTLINYDNYKALNVEKEVDLNPEENYYDFPLNMNEDRVEYYLIDNYPV